MNSKLATLAAAIGFALAAGLAHADPQPLSDPGGHRKLLPQYSDEFNGASLDRSKWNDNTPRWVRWSWSPDNVSVQDGKLILKARYEPHDMHGNHLFYTSGKIENTAPPLTYGYFEARIKGSALYPGVCPSFFLANNQSDTFTELDVVQMQENRIFSNQLDFTSMVWRMPGVGSVPIKNNKSIRNPGWNPADDYHVYGLEWGKNTINWYLDGKLVKTQPNDYFRQPLNVILSLAIRRPYIDTPMGDGFPTTSSVDYVRVWQ